MQRRGMLLAHSNMRSGAEMQTGRESGEGVFIGTMKRSRISKSRGQR